MTQVMFHLLRVKQGLNSRRMPACRDPTLPGAHYARIVHAQSGHSCAARRGQADDLSAALIPGEVLGPSLAKRMKQQDHFSGNRIEAILLCALMDVTGETCQAQVICRGQPSDRFWDNVIHVHL